jgi:uncharacterized MAPEG superfamily protein
VLVIPWILAVLGLFVVQALLPAMIRYWLPIPGLGARVRAALGPRDEQPPLSPLGGRAQRALANMQEALPVFLTLALLHVMQRTPGHVAENGAAVFFVARTAYVPAYLSGIPGVRSAVWTASWVGLGMMIAALRWT